MTHQRRNRLLSVIQNRQFDLTVVLENVNDPHNISAVMRTCDAVGIQEMFVLNTSTSPLKKRWGNKSSSSASKWLSVFTFTDTKECIHAVREKYHHIYATHLNAQSTPLHQTDFTNPIAIVFGNEHSGVSDELLPLTDGSIVIPQVGIVQSLNISVACAVTLYEAFRQKSLFGHYEPINHRFEEEKKTLQHSWNIF